MEPRPYLVLPPNELRGRLARMKWAEFMTNVDGLQSCPDGQVDPDVRAVYCQELDKRTEESVREAKAAMEEAYGPLDDWDKPPALLLQQGDQYWAEQQGAAGSVEGEVEEQGPAATDDAGSGDHYSGTATSGQRSPGQVNDPSPWSARSPGSDTSDTEALMAPAATAPAAPAAGATLLGHPSSGGVRRRAHKALPDG